MGYFNYFIKCIIRNISYKLCKPKVFFTVSLSVIILFCLKHYGFCALDDGDYQMITDGFSTITQNQGVVISQLSSMGVDVTDIENQLKSVNNELSNISSYTNLTNSHLMDLVLKVQNINTALTELAQQQNIYYQNVTNELQDIKNILLGTDTHLTGFYFSDKLEYAKSLPSLNTSGSYDIVDGINFGYVSIGIQLEPGYTYTFVCNSFDTSDASGTYYTFDNISVGNTISVSNLGSFSPNSAVFSITPKKSYSVINLLFTNPSAFTGTNWSIYKKSSSSLSSVTENIDKSNQLQQDQNNLQQEQNDFLKQEQTDSDVSVDGFNSVDSNDITSDGLTGVFTNIYNSISTWTSKDISLPIPYTNKSITIPANYTQNMLSSFGGGWIITFISSIYYFIVARFIIYSITSIINSIKSGSILETDSKNNITTDML